MAVSSEQNSSPPEYEAFNQGYEPTPTQRWELPYALFELRLPNKSSVLDCSIDSGILRERLIQLYPHTSYVKLNPVQDDVAAALSGTPDDSLDRAVCVSTVTGLPEHGRNELIRAVGRKLKEGGIFVLTDSYDSGVYARRADGPDRAEGDGRSIAHRQALTSELLAACDCNGLYQLTPPREASVRGHGRESGPGGVCFGMTFFKGGRRLPAGKKILLALLCWNTRDITLRCLRALVSEALMLGRLGLEPHLCVCDNGSTDGTPEAIREFLRGANLPNTVIGNQRNVGSSVARNQIIGRMLEVGADYLLFTDGDIEVVPFSVFAMFRHLENSEPTLGAVGPPYDPPYQTRNPDQASRYMFRVDPGHVNHVNWIAPTWYGLYRRCVFESGVCLEEGGPFGGAGWGFEDLDLAFQMFARGYSIQLFTGMVNLHHAPQSSIRLMTKEDIDPEAIFDRRKKYIYEKWASVPAVKDGPLSILERCDFPAEALDDV